MSWECCCSVAKSCLTLWPHELQHTRLPCPSLSPGICSNSSIELVIPSNYLIFCRPLPLLSSIFPSNRVFSSKSALSIKWPRYWSFSFSISPSNEYSGLISFRIDWLDLLAVQVTLKSWECSYVNHKYCPTHQEKLQAWTAPTPEWKVFVGGITFGWTEAIWNRFHQCDWETNSNVS